MAEEVFGFNRADADELIKRLGEQPKGVVGLPQDTYDATRLILAFTVAGATARSGTTLGKGTATMRYLAVSGTNRVLTATADTTVIDYFNMSASAVGANKYLMLLRFGDAWLANWEDC